MAMQVGGALTSFSGGFGIQPGSEFDRKKENPSVQTNSPQTNPADAQAAELNRSKAPQGKDEFVRSDWLNEPTEEKSRLSQAKAQNEERTEGTDKKKTEEEAEKEAAEAREKKRKPRAEITVMYAEDIPDPSDPDNPHKKRTVYRRGPTYPAPEFGLGGHFHAIF